MFDSPCWRGTDFVFFCSFCFFFFFFFLFSAAARQVASTSHYGVADRLTDRLGRCPTAFRVALDLGRA